MEYHATKLLIMQWIGYFMPSGMPNNNPETRQNTNFKNYVKVKLTNENKTMQEISMPSTWLYN